MAPSLVNKAFGGTSVDLSTFAKSDAEHCIQRSHLAEDAPLRCETTASLLPKLDVFDADRDNLKQAK